MSDPFKALRDPAAWIVNNAARARGTELQPLVPEGTNCNDIVNILAYQLADMDAILALARNETAEARDIAANLIDVNSDHEVRIEGLERALTASVAQVATLNQQLTAALALCAAPAAAPRLLITEPSQIILKNSSPFAGGDQDVFPFCERFRRAVAGSPDAPVSLLWEHLRALLRGDALALLAGTYDRDLPGTMEEPLALLERTYGLDSAPLLAALKHEKLGTIHAEPSAFMRLVGLARQMTGDDDGRAL